MKRLPSILGITRRLGAALVACGLVGFACGSAMAATSTIYKCFDRHLALVYTDIPCKDGELLDIRAGDPDPAAIARLQQERDALDRSIAQRIIDGRRAGLQRPYSAAPDYGYAPGYDADTYADAAPYFPYGYGVLAGAPMGRQHTHNARADRRSTRQTVVPSRIRSLSR